METALSASVMKREPVFCREGKYSVPVRMAGGKTQVRRSFMKSSNKLKQWLMLLLCVVMTAGALAQTAGAAEPTGNCTNMHTQGIEYFAPMTVLAKDSDKWRGDLTVTAVDGKGVSAGEVIGMELEVINSGLRYQCTNKIVDPDGTQFSCNSFPIHGVISGVYILFKPDLNVVKEDTTVVFQVRESYPITPPANPFWATNTKVKFPPYPCSVNYEFPNDFVSPAGSTLVLYTKKNCDETKNPKCDGVVCVTGKPDKDTKKLELQQELRFYEKTDKYAIVNIIEGDTIKPDRLNISTLQNATFDYTIVLRFQDSDPDTTKCKQPVPPDGDNSQGCYHEVSYTYDYDPATKTYTETITPLTTAVISTSKQKFGPWSELTNSKLPLKLIDGQIYNISTQEKDGWGIPSFPADFDIDLLFWYENTAGTLGYENAIFHFERNLNIQFAPTCDQTAISGSLYDHCQSTSQGFSAILNKPVNYTGKALFYDSNNKTITVVNTDDETKIPDYKKNNKNYPFYFVTRKCVNANCDWVTGTNAYPYSINIADGSGSNHTYRGNGIQFNIKPYGTIKHPFQITSVTFVASEPGTYVIYPFAKYTARNKTILGDGDYSQNAADKWEPIYITINDKETIETCSSLANNGYFKALWNDCLSPSETQLLTFEHIPGKEEAWMENRSNTAVYFPYIQKWSYIPQGLQVASLTYTAEALAGGGRPGEAYCTPAGCYVPPYTRITITGGTMYLEGSPKYDEYYVAYAREDTWNISHLFFSIQIKECKSKKIPDTGISLRSPLKVNTKVDAATSYAFTGNRLQIPAIGLGVGSIPPLPIVHVYYEDGSDGMKWDLSTLGNYVGELEGGSYIPYGGNSVLTGHFWSQGVFVNLKNLNYEDEVIIYGNDGIKYTYKVVEKFIAQPEEVYEMFQQVGERSLTLVTCENYNLNTDEYERRFIVRAVIDSQEPYEMNW